MSKYLRAIGAFINAFLRAQPQFGPETLCEDCGGTGEMWKWVVDAKYAEECFTCPRCAGSGSEPR